MGPELKVICLEMELEDQMARYSANIMVIILPQWPTAHASN